MSKTLLPFLFLIGCLQLTNAQLADSWQQKASLPSTSRAAAFGFAIGNKGYVGGGLNFSSGGSLKDFWQYDPVADSWTQKANFGAGIRSGAVAFAIGNKGYVLTGATNSGKQNDIWQYDTLANTWTQKSDLPALGRNYAVAFAIGSKGYLGTGYTEESFISLNDFWQYDPESDTWTQKANVPGPQRSSAIGFALDGKGYIGTGDTCDYSSCQALNDFYAYDTLNNTWAQKANAGTSLRDNATAFAVHGKGYICTGVVNFSNTNDLLEYDPVLDTWTSRAAIPGPAKENAIAFSIGDHGYVGTGYDNSFNVTNDLYEYTPDTSSIATYIQEIPGNVLVQITPDPVVSDATLTIVSTLHFDNIELDIFSQSGLQVSRLFPEYDTNNESVFHFSKGQLPPGMYFYSVRGDDKIAGKGKFIVM
jgi:N-acetylneuraminic acid mutarotase